jgi:7-carboxy-7-deazaguanine synthase
MMKKNLYDNLNYLKSGDELKFVIGSIEDYEWTRDIIKKYNLENRCIILLSVVFDKLEPITLVQWMLKDKIKARFQLQMHKYIWSPEMKGV